jgi:hypothetical protein
MAVDFGRQQRLGADDLLSLPIRIRKRSPLQELDAFPFFHEEEDEEEDEEERPAPSWMVRRGGACLAVLAVVSAVEVVVLGMVLR